MKVIFINFLVFSNFIAAISDPIEDIFANCRLSQPKKEFEECLKFALNQLNPLFKYGLPEYGVAPFDPHQQSYVEQVRGNDRFVGGYRLLLKDVSEYGWTQSKITDLKMDFEHNAMIYTQYFPLKSLDGHYIFESKVLGQPVTTHGNWSLVLKDYSQTTTIRRLGGQGSRLKVRVVIDKIGGMQLHISDLFRGSVIIESIADLLINTTWRPFLPFMKPLIEDLVSSAFTDIFNESFRYFPVEKFIKY
ncbi:hypothetical protein PVAND_001971 [Polypedilum vanderplanki]|uniref:Uncharacterized protein n=1 Tax=Polypedilum vanderplanki TaxID=319348 RepID=A0A9J6BQT8_POLVA|nr:hypothetical protein PVAND_001971 [Polypedilum vanderplanki]